LSSAARRATRVETLGLSSAARRATRVETRYGLRVVSIRVPLRDALLNQRWCVPLRGALLNQRWCVALRLGSGRG
jgi:hypothetical protein